jgi:putative endonuclease
MSRAHALGQSGEEAALEYLRRKKYEILRRGFRFHRGEIDIIARDKETLVFIEVKTRQKWEHGLPEESVTPAKQRQIRRIAEAYLALNSLSDVPCRFDIVSLYFHETEGYLIHHIADAFQ